MFINKVISMGIKKKVDLIIGIRPDIIRCSEIITYLKKSKYLDFKVVWTNQHYSDELNGIFFRELGISNPDINLKCKGRC